MRRNSTSGSALAFLSYAVPFFITWLAGASLFGQTIETEFREAVASKWLELRKDAFDSLAIEIETREKTTSMRKFSVRMTQT